jgi:hypothetical protein
MTSEWLEKSILLPCSKKCYAKPHNTTIQLNREREKVIISFLGPSPQSAKASKKHWNATMDYPGSIIVLTVIHLSKMSITLGLLKCTYHAHEVLPKISDFYNPLSP